MSLIASISGIRGTIGGRPGDNLTPIEVVGFVAAYGTWLKSQGAAHKVVIGRDARISGPMVSALASNTLVALGLEVIDLGLSTTPTVEMAVVFAGAGGGIILTASHNPGQWNALKLLNAKGEFISADAGQQVLALYQQQAFEFASVDKLGTYRADATYTQRHLDAILVHPLVDAAAVQRAGFRVAVDGINSSGAVFVPLLLEQLGVQHISLLNGEPNGHFAHNPEPLKEHLQGICEVVRAEQLDLGIVVDPDVDRLAFVMDGGELLGEEYTLVTVADYVLQHTPGPVVSNLSSSRALRDLAARYNQPYHAAAVGEVNVVTKMRATSAVLGGEGNGGIIDPKLHYGRDALIGIALVLTYLARSGQKLSALRASYPAYFMAKEKLTLSPGMDVDALLETAAAHYGALGHAIDRQDGVKVDFETSWVHLRKSNTEPIVRIYTEAPTQPAADSLAADVKTLLAKIT